MPRKIVDKPRNHGSMTESAFWSFIRSALRKSSRFWKPALECKKNSRRPYKGSNIRQKWEYKCSKCQKYYMEKFVEIDHIIEVGSLKGSEDLPGFIERLFCEIEGFQILCKTCHNKKTHKK